jgi:hypothetical protein
MADDAIALGLPCFPCGQDKRPVVATGFKAATRDAAAIAAMFAAPAAALIGVPTGRASGFLVIDIDVRDGATGRAWLDTNRHRLPATRTHQTRSGGFHLLFALPSGDLEIRNSASRIAPGVDVRGEGGYIIAPPSAGYSVADDAPIVPMPDWLIAACIARPEPPQPAPRAPVRHDANGGTPYGLAALDDECAAILAAPFGQQETTLNAAALKIGALVAGGELVGAYARGALLSAARGMRNESAREPWTIPEIEAKVARGMQDGERKPRSAPPMQPRPSHTAFGLGGQVAQPVAPAAPEKPQAAVAPATFPTLSIADVMNLPPPVWRVKDLLVEGGLAFIYGASGTFKSFVAIDVALSVAYGIEWHGNPTSRTGVLYVAAEGARGMGKRIAAWQAHHGKTGEPAPLRMLVVPVSMMDPEQVKVLIATTKAAAETEGMPIGMIILDTVARLMTGGDESDTKDAGIFVHHCATLQSELGCDVIGVHHMGKDKDKEERGSTAFRGGADTMIRVDRDGHNLTLKVNKQKDDDEGEPIPLSTTAIDLPGAFDLPSAGSLVITAGHSEERSRGVKQQHVDALFDAIERAWIEKNPLSASAQVKGERHITVWAKDNLRWSFEFTTSLVASWISSGYLVTDMADRNTKRKGLKVLRRLKWLAEVGAEVTEVHD